MNWHSFEQHVAHFTPDDKNRIKKAFHMGEKAHAGQKRKSGEMYFMHPIRVSVLLLGLGADADTIIAALLHDVLEDTSTTLEEIETEFGPIISALVEGLTKISPEELGNNPALNTKIETIRKIFIVMEDDIRVMVIKLVDRLHNMQTISFMSEQKQQQYAEETSAMYVPIANRLCMQDMRNELSTLCLQVLSPNEARMIASLAEPYSLLGKQSIEHIEATIKNKEILKDVHMYLEDRSVKKWQKQIDESPTKLTSMTIVFVCQTVGDCYQLLGNIHQTWRREQLSFQDFINTPGNNGYQALHTTIVLQSGLRVRCKIRTPDMDAYAHFGISTKCFDSKKEGLLRYLPWVKQLDPLNDDTKEQSEEFWHSLQSDILGKSIVIHGSDDQLLSIPEGSTVLDALFYLYDEEALYADKVFLNGLPAYIWDPLRYGARITFTLKKHKTVELDWLNYATTRTAITGIRQALSIQKRSEKILIGKDMLQAEMLLNNMGYLEEYKIRKHQDIAIELEDLYIDIAEGKKTASEVYFSLFKKSRLATLARASKSILDIYSTTTIPINGVIHKVLDRYDVELVKLQYHQTRKYAHARICIACTADQLTSIIEAYSLLQGAVVVNNSHKTWFIVFTPILIGLWWLDIHLATSFLVPSFTVADIVIVRFATLFFIAIGIYAWQSKTNTVIVPKQLNPFNRMLIGSSIALFSTAICTYISLQALSSIDYAIIMNVAMLLTFPLSQKKSKTDWLIIGTVAALSLIAVLAISTAPLLYILTGILTGVSFMLYSYFGSKYQKEEQIFSRFPLFVTYIAGICTLFGLSLLPMSQLHDASIVQLCQLILYHIVFTSIPYLLYFTFAKRSLIIHVGPYIPLVLPLVFATHTLLSGTWPYLIHTMIVGVSALWIIRTLMKRQSVLQLMQKTQKNVTKKM